MSDMTPEKAADLRKPFPRSAIGKLPKGGTMLDYVGHAATTDRLLAVDPGWTWEPFAVDERGLPALDSRGNLWIRMTVCGVTRIGVGDGKSAKEVIGDAIRNAAMRFGVALDLWSKEELEGSHDDAAPAAEPAAAPTAPPQETRTMSRDAASMTITQEQSRKLHASFNEAGITDRDERLEYAATVIGHPVATSKDLTKREASAVIDALQKVIERGAA